MIHSRLILAGLATALSLAAACSASSSGNVFDDDDDGEGGGNATSQSGNGGSTGAFSGGVGGLDLSSGVGGSTGSGSSCDHAPNIDGDADGFTGDQGDCNDCDANVNPGAIEVFNDTPDEDGGMPPPADEDCDGTPDNVAPSCDGNLGLADPDPMHAAQAIDLCQQATAEKWGVSSAAWVRADGSPGNPLAEIGIRDSFGPFVNPQGGLRLLGLSSGYARVPGEPGECGSFSCPTSGASFPPAGFPADVPGCSGGTNINDDVALELTLKSPTNATGYSFNFDFYSFEYPEWVCTTFNDQFIALVNPPPAGSINGNISFDSMNNPVSVNIAFFNVCSGCALGTNELSGTGFDVWDDAGATSWLKTQAPLAKGGDVITIRFAIWDTGDSAWDSTVLIDNFQWIANGGTVTTGTTPQPDPK